MALYKGTTKYYIGAKGESEIPENIYEGASALSMGQIIPAGTYITQNLSLEGDVDLESANIVKDTTIFGTSGSYKSEFPNGQKWRFIETPFKPGALCYANGVYVAGDIYNTGLWYSLDGENWNQSNITYGNYVGTIIYANGYWLAASVNGAFSFISADGKTWSEANQGNTINIASNGNIAVIVNIWRNNGAYYLPLNGTLTWTQSSLTSGVDGVVYEGGYFIATVGTMNQGSKSYYSNDGATWNEISLGFSNVCYCQGKWYAHQFNSNNIYTTDNIESGNWVSCCTLPTSGYVPSIFKFEGDYLICGIGTKLYFIKNGSLIKTISNVKCYDYYRISDDLSFIVTYDEQSMLINTKTGERTTVDISYNYAMSTDGARIKVVQKIGDQLFALNPNNSGLAISPIWEPEVEPAPPNSYLTFKGNEEFSLEASYDWDGTLYYSTDAITWSEWDSSVISSNKKKLYLRGENNTEITPAINPWQFTGESDNLQIFSIGNIETLLDYQTVLNGEHPVMEEFCYANMFYDCTSLVTAPELPATTLTISCYDSMFSGCTSLITAPELPATTLVDYCYYNMFYDCTSLVTAPELPATTLTSSCYNGMFFGCTSLITVPELPATTLVDYCYHYMFYGCTGLNIYTVVLSLSDVSYAWTCTSDNTNKEVECMFQHCQLDGSTFPNNGTPTEGATYYWATLD